MVGIQGFRGIQGFTLGIQGFMSRDSGIRVFSTVQHVLGIQGIQGFEFF